MKSKIETARMFLQISMGSCSKGNVTIPPNKTYTLRLDYPFAGEKHYFTIKSGKKSLSANDLIGKICSIYENKIYKNDATMDKYGVFGHGIDDLTLSEIKVNHVKKTITIGTGS